MIILITIYKFEPYTKINMWQVKHKTRSSFPISIVVPQIEKEHKRSRTKKTN